jgi:hypothetical protein
VDTHEPPSQLQEALKESAKVDPEYNLPTWVPKMRVKMNKRRIPEVDLRVDHVLPRLPHKGGTIREHSWDIQGELSGRP